MGYLDIRCPGCRQVKHIPPGNSFKVCERCGTPHCVYETSPCKVEGCRGWLQERRNPY